jgi:tetratricopeptide (TPR) repeat protein
MILENLVNSEKRFIQLLPYTGTALTYALLENKQQCKQYLKEALPFLEIETRPELKLLGLQAISEIYRLLSKFENAKTMCQQIISWLLKNAEEPEELFYLAEARLVMGKILVDMGNYQESTLIPHQKK